MEPPALLGGPRTIETGDGELFHRPIVTAADEQAVLDVLRAGAMSRTEITRAFEQASLFHGRKTDVIC